MELNKTISMISLASDLKLSILESQRTFSMKTGSTTKGIILAELFETGTSEGPESVEVDTFKQRERVDFSGCSQEVRRRRIARGV